MASRRWSYAMDRLFVLGFSMQRAAGRAEKEDVPLPRPQVIDDIADQCPFCHKGVWEKEAPMTIVRGGVERVVQVWRCSGKKCRQAVFVEGDDDGEVVMANWKICKTCRGRIAKGECCCNGVAGTPEGVERRRNAGVDVVDRLLGSEDVRLLSLQPERLAEAILTIHRERPAG